MYTEEKGVGQGFGIPGRKGKVKIVLGTELYKKIVTLGEILYREREGERLLYRERERKREISRKDE